MRLGDATSIRSQVKRLVRTPRFHWLAKPAQGAWYYWRSISELTRASAVLSTYSPEVRKRPTVELVDFVFSKYGGLFRPFQNRVEIGRLVERVRDLKPERIVEIGTARGGTLFLLSCAASPTASMVSIDLPAGPYGGGYPAWKGRLYRRLMGARQSLTLIRGNSHDDAVLARAVDALDREPIDLLFIDGDHSYEGARTDFARYRRLVREGGWIVFHDIIESALDREIDVAPLWREIATRYESSEIVESRDQGEFGIGVVVAPRIWSAEEG